jgi:hypothetical protein
MNSLEPYLQVLEDKGNFFLDCKIIDGCIKKDFYLLAMEAKTMHISMAR